MKKILFFIFYLCFGVIFLFRIPTASAASCKPASGSDPICYPYAQLVCIDDNGHTCAQGTRGCSCKDVCFTHGLVGTARCTACSARSSSSCENGISQCPQTIGSHGEADCMCVRNRCVLSGGGGNSCNPSNIDCSGKCGKWDRGCGVAPKDCGQNCNSNQYCQHNSSSGTGTGGYCKPKPNNCNPDSCADLGYDGKKGSACSKQADGCGGFITCGGCNSGLSCTGKNNNGAGGKCTPSNNPPPNNPTPLPSQKPTDAPAQRTVSVVVFYDKYNKNSQKGIEPTYNVCYPAVNSSGSLGGNTNPSNVDVTITSGETGIATKTYTNKSYANCRTNGGNSSSRGFTIQRSDKSKSIKLNVPSGYTATGYNYSVDGKATVRCISGSTVKGCNGSTNSTPAIQGNNINVYFGIEKTSNPPTPKVNGFVFIDDNGNDQYEPGDDGNSETCFDSTLNTDLTIKVGSDSKTFTQKPGCNNFSYTNTSSAQTIKLNSIPTGYKTTGFEYQDATHPGNTGTNCAAGDSVTDTGWCIHDSAGTDTSQSVDLAGESEVHYGIKPAQVTYSVSGYIFIDSPRLGYKDSGDPAYHDAQPKVISAFAIDDAGVVSNTATTSDTAQVSGYTLSGLDPGKYRITYTDPTFGSGPPTGFKETYPQAGTPPSFDVKVSNSDCWIVKKGQTTLNDAKCVAGGSITNLNFGISNTSTPWFQTVGGDMRVDADLTDYIPSGLYASVSLGSPVADPGILFTAQSSAHLTVSGTQSSAASTKGWLSVNNPYNPVSGGTRLSHSYLTSVINRGGIKTLGMWPGGNGSNPPCSDTKPKCTLPAGFAGGVYTASQGLTILNNSYTFQANTNYIFLVNGDLKIQGNILVPATSTVIFAATGDILIDQSVRNVNTIEGVYSAEGKFDTGTGSNALTVNGSVIANAALKLDPNIIQDVFTNSRDLGNSNATTPAVKFVLRPDFLINLPETIKVPNYVIQDVAPGPAFTFGSSQGTPTPTPTTAPTPTPTPTPLATPTPTAAPTPGFRESGGKVVIEAEDYSIKYSGNNGHSWALGNSSGATPGTTNNYMTTTNGGSNPAGPGVNCSGGNAAQMNYPIYFQTTGTYYVFLRINSVGDNASSKVGVALDCGQGNNIDWGSSTGGWLWDDQNTNLAVVTITVTQADIDAGIHYFNIWEREDGASIDRIVLKQTSGTPSGSPPGGNESPFN